MSDTDEALKIWEALKPMVDAEIRSVTKSCTRAKKMSVASLPNGHTIGVQEPYGKVINIPYNTALQNIGMGDAVWVLWFFDNASTMFAFSKGNGSFN